MFGVFTIIYPETNRVSTLYSVAAILHLQFLAHVILLPMSIIIIISSSSSSGSGGSSSSSSSNSRINSNNSRQLDPP